MTSSHDQVLLHIADGVATVTLNRVSVLNALDAPLAEGLCAAMARCEADSQVRAVILQGNGPAFMAGGDLKLFQTMLDEPPESRRAWFERMVHHVNTLVIQMRRMPKPILGSVHGSCAGFGISLMLACDLVLAAHDCVFTLAYSLIGTSPDGGATFHLPRVAGLKKAMEIALLGDRFTADQAESWGLINRVVAAEHRGAETQKLAHRLRHGPTQAYARTKILLNGGLATTLETQLQAEAESFAACATTHDFAEGIKAFLDKRNATFTGS